MAPASVSTLIFSTSASLEMSDSMPVSTTSIVNSDFYVQQNASYAAHGSQSVFVSQHMTSQTPNLPNNIENGYFGPPSSATYPRFNNYQMYRSPGCNVPVLSHHGSESNSVFRMQQIRPGITPVSVCTSMNNMPPYSLNNANVVPAHLVHHHGSQVCFFLFLSRSNCNLPSRLGLQFGLILFY